MLSLLAGQLWRPMAIALLIAAAAGYRALLVHQRDTARSAAAAAGRERAAGAAGATAMRAATRSAQALEHARIDTGCAAAIRWGNAQAAELGRW